jgi:RNA polymerase sigma factor (sigma-70 family)
MSEAAAPGRVASSAGMTRLLSDESLAKRAVKGDERAFAAIFRRYHQSLYRFCLAILGNPQDAQDALQNTMVKVLRALPGEQRRLALKPWLYRVAHNESIDLLRRRRETHRLDAELAAPGPGLAEQAAQRERLGQLIANLDELPERQRGALVMRELGGLDFAEIGSALGTSPAVVRQTVYEARLSLRQMDEGREMSCEAVTRALSDGDGRIGRRRDLRAHLRSCAGCRRFSEEIDGRGRDFAALSPLPAAAAAGIANGLLGSHGAGSAGAMGTLGGGAAKSIGASVALKGAATVAVVAAIGVTAAHRGGLIDGGQSRGDGSEATQAQQAASAEADGRRSTDRSGSAAALGAGGSTAGTGSGNLGASHSTKATAAKAASPQGEKASAEAAPTAANEGSPAARPHGNGRQREHPSASAHGQQTAASHRAAHHGTAGAKTHPSEPTHPAKPSHPVHPSNPGPEKGGSSSSQGAGLHPGQPQGAPELRGAAVERASPEHESGPKP